MKAAIIGCGLISGTHIDALKKKDVIITALCDIIPEKARKLIEEYSLDCEVFSDYKIMLNQIQTDTVHICTPHYLHAEMAVYALSKNINVLLEKPACINEEEIEALKKAQAKSKAQLGICFQNRFLQSNINVKKFLLNKDIKSIIGTVFWNREKDYYTCSNWRGKKITEGGGVLINQAIHTLDLMLWFGGMPDYVTANISNNHLKDVIDVEDTAQLYYERGNTKAMLFASTASSFDYPINIKIDTGGNVAEILGSMSVIDNQKYTEKAVDFTGKDYWSSGHYKLIEDFYNCITKKIYFAIDLEEGTKALKVLFAVYKSNGIKIKV